jgi:hypothetical protein
MGFTIGSLSESALSEFTDFLDSAKNGSTDEPPYHLLQGDDNVTPIQFSNGQLEVNMDVEISSRMDLGRYLSNLIPTREDLSKVLDDKGAGSFLAIVFFHRICTRNDDGIWNVKANDRYIPNLRQRTRFYRHLVQSPLSVYKLHGEMGRLYLCQPVSKHPDTMEQIASREELVLNPNIIELADRLYWDEEEQYVKETAANIDPLPDGALRRFVGPGSFCEQYGTVYDFWSMDANALTSLLPQEFNEWLD